MLEFKLHSKIFLVILLAAGVLWLGSYTVKLFNFFNFFDLAQDNSLILKSNLTGKDLNPVIFELLPVLTISLISYIVFIFSLLIFILTAKLNFKANGWIFITVIIILFCLPFEVYLSFKDFDLIKMITYGNIEPMTAIEIIKSRITALSSYPIIALILHYSIILLIVFKPLTKKY